jgi:hypothetical protein
MRCVGGSTTLVWSKRTFGVGIVDRDMAKGNVDRADSVK